MLNLLGAVDREMVLADLVAGHKVCLELYKMQLWSERRLVTSSTLSIVLLQPLSFPSDAVTFTRHMT